MTDPRPDALDYVHRWGWHVFVLSPRSKVPPKGSHGLLDATQDEDVIRSWPSDANIALACGPSGIVVIDCDVPHGDMLADGRQVLGALVDDREWPEVPLCQITRNGGRQYFFRADGAYKSHPQWQLERHHQGDRVQTGIDVRAMGGGAVLPPSAVPADVPGGSGLYRWVEPVPDEVPLLPEWLGDLLPLYGEVSPRPQPQGPVADADGARPYALAALEGECAELSSMGPETGRNARLNAAAWKIGRLVGAGALDYGEAYSELERSAMECGHGTPDYLRSIAGTLRSGLAAGMRDPKYIEPPYQSRAPAPHPGPSIEEDEAPEAWKIGRLIGAGALEAPPPDDTDCPDPDGWKSGLIRTAKGEVKDCSANTITLVRGLLASRLAWNVRSQIAVWTEPPPWDLTRPTLTPLDGDTDRVECCRWLAHVDRISSGLDVVWAALVAAAKLHPYDLVADYLRGLPEYDREPRVDYWLSTYAGVADSPYTRAVGAAWLISAVARAMEPGCKADHMLVLEGGQGILKSTTLEALAGDHYAEVSLDPQQKDSILAVHGPWIIEWGELSGMGRREAESIKAFLSRSTDRVRPPYGKAMVDLPRRCVVAGTTNEGQWLNDQTGGRRYWPVRVASKCRPDRLRRDRDLIWAEAFERWAHGEQWWLSAALEQEAAVEQADRLEMDAWLDRLSEALTAGRYSTVDFVQIGDLMALVGVETAQQNSTATRRLSRHMARLGWEQSRRKIGSVRVRGFKRPEALAFEEEGEETHG